MVVLLSCVRFALLVCVAVVLICLSDVGCCGYLLLVCCFLLVGWGGLGLLVRCFVVLGFCNLVAIPLIVLVGCIRLVFMCC